MHAQDSASGIIWPDAGRMVPKLEPCECCGMPLLLMGVDDEPMAWWDVSMNGLKFQHTPKRCQFFRKARSLFIP
jgi:hypothetical protein